MTELGINNSNDIAGNTVYKHVNIPLNSFFEQQERAIKDLRYNLKDEDKHIPLLYWTSKQHKNPYKSRFIAGASHCTSKSLSIDVSLALKCIKKSV